MYKHVMLRRRRLTNIVAVVNVSDNHSAFIGAQSFGNNRVNLYLRNRGIFTTVALYHALHLYRETTRRFLESSANIWKDKKKSRREKSHIQKRATRLFPREKTRQVFFDIRRNCDCGITFRRGADPTICVVVSANERSGI